MVITIRPVNAADITEFLDWKYEPPHDDYNIKMPLGEALEYFLDPATQCHAIVTDGELSGYCTYGKDAQVPGGDYTASAVDIGAAIMPALTGHGHGATYVAAIIDFAVRTFDPATLRVSIASPNVRATKVWIANGFSETQRFHTPREILGTTEFAMFERRLGE